MINVITVGKKHDSWVVEGIERYSKRLHKPFDINWVFLPHSSREGIAAREEESQRILARLSPDAFVILLDETGQPLSSPALAKTMQDMLARSNDAVIVIGGAYGVNDGLMQRANLVWSLSPLVFPHQLVRLILVEQIYRAQSIASNHPYHHE